jgi:uncharacterized protein YcnI
MTAVLVAAATLLAAGASSAYGHVQVTPARVAPSDPVLFTVLVPNERDVPTVRVELDIPRSVLPFGFEATPGWTRRLVLNRDQSIRSVTWRGDLAQGAFARFTLLASTPARQGILSWRARQIYEDGQIVRWEGREGSDQPAAIVRVDRAAPRQNAGGEGTSPDAAGDTGAPPAGGEQAGAGSRRTDVLTIAAVTLAAGALIAAVLALVLVGRARVRS